MALIVRSSHYKQFMTLLVLLCLLAAACGPELIPTPRPATEVVQVPVDTQVAPAYTPVPATDTPTPVLAPTITTAPTSRSTPEPTVKPEEDEGMAPGDGALLEGVIAAIDAAISEEPWRFENYHHLRDARLEMATQRPLDELDAEIARYDQLLEDNPEDAETYAKRGRAKYQRTVLSGEPADVEDLFADTEGVTVQGDPFVSYHLNLEHAIADLNQAIELDPDYAEAYHMRGLAYHLQGLEYIGIALVESHPADIELAIRDYDRAIELDPDMTAAYYDRGSAYAEQGRNVARAATEMPDEVFQSLEQAIGDFTAAIEQDPQSESTYLNRAFANGLLTIYLGIAEEEPESSGQRWLDDSTKVIELNPENMWGYLLRAFAYQSAQESAEDESAAAQLESQANDDFETFQRLGTVLLQQYELEDLVSRMPTLSSGPAIDPRGARPGLLGTLEEDVYASPDGSFRLQVPDLMQPNAVIWDEMASSGDLLVWFEDDLARWYALQVHPGTPAEQSLEEWVRANVADILDVQEEYQKDTPLGTASVLVYRYAQPEADCSTAIVHHGEHFYAASYCLLDHYAGEGEESSIRTFGELYGIEYEPVDALAVEFIGGLEFVSQE